MIVGIEWLIEAAGCDRDALRSTEIMRGVFSRVMADLKLKAVGEDNWHKFGGEGGVTGILMLTESHLACHTYPEYEAATFNLYCCKTRPEWNWSENLIDLIGARNVKVTKIERGFSRNKISATSPEISKSEFFGGGI